MKSLRALPALLLTSLKSIRAAVPGEGIAAQAEQGKGQSLLRLHEYQHRVILEIFKITIAGFLAFSLLLLAFAVYSLIDPNAPKWMSLIIGVMSALLLFALYRTIQESKAYRKNYLEITAHLRAKLQQQVRAGGSAQSAQAKGVVEHRLLSALKPKEHAGWDFKTCTHCRKTIELLANVCQHCGERQDTVLVN